MRAYGPYIPGATHKVRLGDLAIPADGDEGTVTKITTKYVWVKADQVTTRYPRKDVQIYDWDDERLEYPRN